MRFSNKIVNILNEEDEYDDDEINLSLDEMEERIEFIVDKLIMSWGIKGLVIYGLYKGELDSLIKDFNSKCPAYDISYDENGIKRIFSEKKYTGYYNNKKYYMGLEDLSYDGIDVPNIGLRK